MSTTQLQLQQEYAAKALALQISFQAKLQTAQSLGDLTEIHRCATEFQEDSTRLLAWLNEKMVEAQAPQNHQVTDQEMDIYSHEHCAANLNALAYRGDRNQMLKFMKDPGFSRLSKEVSGLNPMGNTHRALLSKSMRLTPALTPSLFRVVDRVKEKLGMRVTPEIFVVQRREFSASCYPIIHGRLPLSISSGLLENFSEEELAFIVGRSFAKALFDHFRIPTDLLMSHASDRVTPVQFLKLASWARASEISADRLGLLCCESLEVAASGLFKLSSGLVSNKFPIHAADYIAQFDHLETYLQEATDKDVEDLYSAHSFNPIRLKALEIFHRSELFKELSGRGAGDIGNKQMEVAIHGFCRWLEPSYLDETGEEAGRMRELVFLTAQLIARTDGEVSPLRAEQLASFLGDVPDRATELGGLDEKQIASLLQDHAERLRDSLPVITKLNLVHDLGTVISTGFGHSDDQLRILAMICESLGVDPMFAVSVLPAPDFSSAA